MVLALRAWSEMDKGTRAIALLFLAMAITCCAVLCKMGCEQLGGAK